jgi:hypothetical protein
MPHTPSEQLEQALFIEVIRLAPEGSALSITTDSWQDLPRIFGKHIIINESEWLVPLSPENRNFLMEKALSQNVQTQFVHFYIVTETDEIILSSYDGMCSIFMEANFPEYKRLEKEYVSPLMT